MQLSAGEHHVADTARCSRTCDGGGGSSAGGDKGGSGACSSTGACAPRRSAAQDERRAKGLLSANLGESRRISANLGKSRRISRTGTTSVAKGEATAPLPRPPPWSGDSGRPSGSYFAEAGGPIGMAIGGLIAALLWQGRRVPGMKGRMRRSRWTRASRWTTKGDMSDSGWGGPGRDGSRENCSVARRCSSSSD